MMVDTSVVKKVVLMAELRAGKRVLLMAES
jgi:hypothetical protein